MSRTPSLSLYIHSFRPGHRMLKFPLSLRIIAMVRSHGHWASVHWAPVHLPSIYNWAPVGGECPSIVPHHIRRANYRLSHPTPTTATTTTTTTSPYSWRGFPHTVRGRGAGGGRGVGGVWVLVGEGVLWGLVTHYVILILAVRRFEKQLWLLHQMLKNERLPISRSLKCVVFVVCQLNSKQTAPSRG